MIRRPISLSSNDISDVPLGVTLGESLFAGAESFLGLLVRHASRSLAVVARSYGNGAWSQFSGSDLVAHLGRSCYYWRQELGSHLVSLSSLSPTGDQGPKQAAILFQSRNSYVSLVSAWGALLAGFNVMFLPQHASQADIRWCLSYFNGVAIAQDLEEIAPPAFGGLHVPLFQLAASVWIPQDKHAEPPLLAPFRRYKALLQAQETGSEAWEALVREGREACPGGVGRCGFISFGHDGYQKPELLPLDALVLTAQNFLLSSNVPPALPWRTMELLVPANPFAHVSRFCALLKNGVLGFADPAADLAANLAVLRPTLFFAAEHVLRLFVDCIEEQFTVRQKVRSRLAKTIEKTLGILDSYGTNRLSEVPFHFAKRGLRLASKTVLGRHLIRSLVRDLRFVVHGMGPAPVGAVKVLERLGIPVIETYGTTGAAGLLSSNTFDLPHLNLIGTPLPHVSFQLGADSILEYKIHSSLFPQVRQWQKTGDVAQMTAHGFMITGRKAHLFVTSGGVKISPLPLERRLKENPLIADVCLIGDKRPFLSALVVLENSAYSDAKNDPQAFREQVQELINAVNETLPRQHTIKKFVILEKPFQESNGEKLLSGAINRLRIVETRSAAIQDIYKETTSGVS